MDYNPRRLNVTLPPYYVKVFQELKQEKQVGDLELIIHLVDTYTLEEPLAFLYIKDSLVRKMRTGLSNKLITSLRLLYIFIGHILSRIDPL
jgi:hypothetical protein